MLIGAMLGWLGLQLLGGRLGLPLPVALALDFTALAAFVWALVVTYQIWRSRRNA